jgi:hypothetical protein
VKVKKKVIKKKRKFTLQNYTYHNQKNRSDDKKNKNKKRNGQIFIVDYKAHK